MILGHGSFFPENLHSFMYFSPPFFCCTKHRMVERSNLAALEFLMSKQPRGSVRMSAGNAVGACVSNIFVDVKKFQTRFHDAMDKASTHGSKVCTS